MIMKRYKNIFLAVATAFGFVACDKEAPFSAEPVAEHGRFLSSSISVSLNTDENLVRSAEDGPDVSLFDVDFYKNGANIPEQSYKYGEMPEMVMLPVGEYVVKVSYGGDYGEGAKAAFDAPFYKGESGKFTIEKDKVTDHIDPIVCGLANVKVSIVFDPSLKNAISPDSKVTVKVGENGTSLDFTVTNEKSGYFEFAEGSNTLAATFSGSVDGDLTTETKTKDNVAPGNHYRITFKLHRVDPNDPGDINPDDESIKVDATVTTDDRGDTNVEPGEEEFLPDDRYPEEDPKDPDNPDNPDNPKENGPTITGEAPINLDEVNDVNDEVKAHCVLNVHSDTGITEFKVKIDSETLTSEVLEGVKLSTDLDLVNPGSLKEGLQSINLPVEVAGEKDVRFDITEFMPLLEIYGAANHKFILTVSDKNGTTTKTLQLRTL